MLHWDVMLQLRSDGTNARKLWYSLKVHLPQRAIKSTLPTHYNIDIIEQKKAPCGVNLPYVKRQPFFKQKYVYRIQNIV